MKIFYSIVTGAPAVEPIDRDDIGKLALLIDSGTQDDALLDIWIQAAREIIEERTGRSLITQTRVQKLDAFPCSSYIRLSHGPIQSVTSVKYFDENEVEQTLDPSLYWTDTVSPIGTITIKNSWPGTFCRPNAISVECVCGYGDAAEDVPAPLRSAVLMRFASLYENRQSVAAGSYNEVPKGEDDLISQYILTQDVTEDFSYNDATNAYKYR